MGEVLRARVDWRLAPELAESFDLLAGAEAPLPVFEWAFCRSLLRGWAETARRITEANAEPLTLARDDAAPDVLAALERLARAPLERVYVVPLARLRMVVHALSADLERPDRGVTVMLSREGHDALAALLVVHPLPWRVDGARVVDADERLVIAAVEVAPDAGALLLQLLVAAVSAGGTT